jgi:hypothetical protein
MNEKMVGVFFVVSLICIIAVSGCIAPPKEAPLTTTVNKNTIAVPTVIVTTIPIPVYVTFETPYVTPGATSTITNRTIPVVSPIMEDYVVIYSIKNQPFAYSKSAVSFDLKNPPMLIDFRVSAANITGEGIFTSKYGDSAGDEVLIKTDYLDPGAWFEITVREKSSGKIVLQDGFGQSKQYGAENIRHLKIYSAGDYLIEFSGNKLSASVNLSVKREGNINQSVV